jgi:hypothetical protein
MRPVAAAGPWLLAEDLLTEDPGHGSSRPQFEARHRITSFLLLTTEEAI